MNSKTKKENDIHTWLEVVKSQLEEYNDYDRHVPQNDVRKALKKILASLDHFDEHFKWWKNTVEAEELHEAEHLYKNLKSLHVVLENEYKYT